MPIYIQHPLYLALRSCLTHTTLARSGGRGGAYTLISPGLAPMTQESGVRCCHALVQCGDVAVMQEAYIALHHIVMLSLKAYSSTKQCSAHKAELQTSL